MNLSVVPILFSTEISFLPPFATPASLIFPYFSPGSRPCWHCNNSLTASSISPGIKTENTGSAGHCGSWEAWHHKHPAREFDTSKLKRIPQSLETGLFFVKFLFLLYSNI